MIDVDALELTGPGDRRTQIVVELMTHAVYGRESVADALAAASLVPGEYPLETAKLAWMAAVPDAARRGLLGRLVGYVGSGDPAFSATLQERLAEHARGAHTGGRWYHHEDPYSCMFVGAGASRAVIDRRQLRDGLRDLAHDEYRIMVVTGEPRSGKSHSWVLIDHLRNAGLFAGHRFTRVTTHDWAGDVTGEDLARSLADRLGLTIELSPSGEMPDARMRKFVDRLVGEYPQGDGTIRWIILDGLDRPGVQSSALDFARRLIVLVHDGELPATRLVVTGLAEVNLDIERTIRQEVIPRIDRTILWDFLRDVAGHLHRTVDDTELDTLIAEALGAGDLDLRQLENNVYRLVRQRWQGAS